MKLITLVAAVIYSIVLSACTTDEKVGVSYHAYNHTDKHIVSIIINGEGGILDARAHGEGGGVCCVVLPKHWRPGLMATVKWQEDDIPVLNPDGTRKIINGVPASTESPWKEKIVEVPKYGEEMGIFFMHFFPDDEVKVLVSLHGAGGANHSYPHPDDDQPKKR